MKKTIAFLILIISSFTGLAQIENKSWNVFAFKKSGESKLNPSSDKLLFKSSNHSYTWGVKSGKYELKNNTITLRDNGTPTSPIDYTFKVSEGVYLILSRKSLNGNDVYYSYVLLNDL